jgi:YD repeat-containing protein
LTVFNTHFNNLVNKINLITFQMKRKLFLLVLISTFSTLISAQTPTYDPRMDLPKVTPPSPNAATLGKYGDIAVGLYAGTPNVSIPVYDIKLGSFSLPVNVSYHCQGLKVEEKSGNIGLNWALNAGGVITRTVKGLPDENGLGYWSHATWTNHYISSDELRTEAFCNGTYDAQPDMFYFNFGSYSGKFVVDATSAHVAHIIPDQPGIQIKVMDNALSSFQITDDKGIQYIFDVKETTTDDNSPPTILNYTSAWYLSKIITPAGNITFTYANDQTYFNQYVESDHLNGIASEDAAKFNPGWKVANNVITVDSRILTGITTPVETLKFYTLADRKDMTGARRITECVVQDYNTKVLKKIIFNQSYFGNSTTTSPEDCRLKLDQIREYSADSTTYKAYSFNYNGPGQVPSVKSLSQDFWGYYNGKANASLLPNLDLPTWGSYIVGQITHYGDRTPDVNYAMIGCLNQITYPTGGTTQFTYESNDYSYVNGAPLNDPLQTVHQVSASATENSTTNIPTTTTNFTINAAQTVTVTTQGSYSGAPPVENGPSVAINLINADGSRTNISTRSMINSTITTTQALAVGNYEIISSVDGATQTATGTVQYYSLDGYIHTKVAGGIRIQKVLNTDPITSLTTQKTYSYKSATDATLSSGVLVSPINLVSLKYNFVYIWVLRSATTTNYLGTTQGNFIGYGRVSETEGTGSNGRKDSYFTTAFDYPNTLGTDSLIHDLNSVVASNVDDYKNKYLNDYDACRGFLTKELTYNSANALLKETDIQYNIPAALTPTSANYFQLNSKAGLSNYMCIINCAQCYCPSSPQIPCLTCSPFGVDMFYVFDNQIVCPWIYKTQTTETQYDQSGNNPVTMLTNFYYDNPLHGQVTRVELTNSKGIVVKTLNKYAQDKSAINNLTATASLAVDAMVSKNMVSNVLESEHYTNGVFNSRLRTNYRIWDANGMIVSPENVQFQTQLSSALETRSQFTNYDSKGNLLEDSKFNGPTTSYQWGYNFHYPVAQVVNSKSKDSFYDGFEEGDGNSTDAKTGHYSHTGTYTQSLTSLDNGYYTLTYWLKSGGVWSFQTISINVTTGAYTINLTGQIDDVRFYSAYGEMTTYTYDPLVGVTSSTDAKGEIIYYEYDSFQRLQNIKDKDGNIIKSFTYHYQGQ